MVAAYESVVFRTLTEFLEPQSLTEPVLKHLELKTVGIGEREREREREKERGVIR